MTTIPLLIILKTNWLHSHHNQCSKLSLLNYYETIIIGDSIARGLSRYQNLWAKFLQPLSFLNCGIGGDEVQHVLMRSHNLPVVKSIKKVVVLCDTNNLNQDSPDRWYHTISIFVCGIHPRGYNWLVNRVYINPFMHSVVNGQTYFKNLAV